MSPHASATGMNSSGGIMPCTGWFQRTSDSTPPIVPVARRITGW